MELISAVAVLIAGFFLGVQHALDADHVIAVSTMVSRSRSLKRSALLGILWGSGHTTTLLLTGLLVLFFRLAIPKVLESLFEVLVGFVLVLLGAMVVKNLRAKSLHIHSHNHNGKTHVHVHGHSQTAAHQHQHRIFFVGTLHGLAGSAALMLIILSTIKSVGLGILYIIFFGAGSIFGMLVFAALFYVPLFITERHFPLVNQVISLTIGLASIFFGVYLLLMIG